MEPLEADPLRTAEVLPCEAEDERPAEEDRLTEETRLAYEARLTEPVPEAEEERVAAALERTWELLAEALRVAPEVRVAATERAMELLTTGFTVGRAAPPLAGK